MRKLSLLMSLSVLLFAAQCADHPDNPLPDLKVETTLSGANENPALTTSATGKFTGTLNQQTRLLKFTLTFSSLTPSAGHIHSGAVGVNGPVIIPFPSLTTSPYSYEVVLTPAQVDLLKTNMLYTNLHTPANPGGEIRGQLMIVP